MVRKHVEMKQMIEKMKVELKELEDTMEMAKSKAGTRITECSEYFASPAK